MASRPSQYYNIILLVPGLSPWSSTAFNDSSNNPCEVGKFFGIRIRTSSESRFSEKYSYFVVVQYSGLRQIIIQIMGIIGIIPCNISLECGQIKSPS